MGTTATEAGANTTQYSGTGYCASLRLMSAPQAGQGGHAQFTVQYPPNTPQSQQFLAAGQVVNLPINPNWSGQFSSGEILEIGAPGT